MNRINEGIIIGTQVQLKSKRTNSIYLVTEMFKNFKGELWAVCKNIESDEISHQPMYDLKAV